MTSIIWSSSRSHILSSLCCSSGLRPPGIPRAHLTCSGALKAGALTSGTSLPALSRARILDLTTSVSHSPAMALVPPTWNWTHCFTCSLCSKVSRVFFPGAHIISTAKDPPTWLEVLSRGEWCTWNEIQVCGWKAVCVPCTLLHPYPSACTPPPTPAPHAGNLPRLVVGPDFTVSFLPPKYPCSLLFII